MCTNITTRFMTQYQSQRLIILVFLVSSKISEVFYCIFQNSDVAVTSQIQWLIVAEG